MVKGLPTCAMLLLLAVASCAPEEGGGDVKPVASVTTSIVTLGSIERSLSAYGLAEIPPGSERTLAAPVESTVDRIVAPSGSRVEKGQLVVTLRPTPGSLLELAKARTDAGVAAEAAARATRLRGSGLVNDGEVETAAAAAHNADALLRSLNARAGANLALRSPLAGIVESIAVNPGAQVAAGSAVATIGSPNGLRIRLGVDVERIKELHVGQRLKIGPISGGTLYDASISDIDPRLDSQTRLASLIVYPKGVSFSPGQPILAIVPLELHRGVLKVPSDSIVYDGDRPYVYIVNLGLAQRRNVEIGIQAGDAIEIVKGVTPGERIVVQGAGSLEGGMAIRETAQQVVPSPKRQ